MVLQNMSNAESQLKKAGFHQNLIISNYSGGIFSYFFPKQFRISKDSVENSTYMVKINVEKT